MSCAGVAGFDVWVEGEGLEGGGDSCYGGEFGLRGGLYLRLISASRPMLGDGARRTYFQRINSHMQVDLALREGVGAFDED